MLQRYDLVQHVADATRGDNTLDLLLTSSDDARVLSQIAVQPTCFSDHRLVTSRIHVPRDKPTISTYQYRDLRRVDIEAFNTDVRQSSLYTFDSAMSVDDYVDLYDSEMQRLLDTHAPLTSRTRRIGRHDCRWLSEEARDAKRRCRRLERRFRRTRSTVDRSAFRAARKTAREAITQSRSDAIKQRFSDVAGDSAATWSAVRDVLHRNSRPVYSDSQCQSLAVGFGQFFADKLRRTRESIAVSLASTFGPVHYARRHVGPTLTQLPPTSPGEVLKILKSSRLKPSPVDVLPTALLRSAADTLWPILAHIANLSFSQCRSLQLLRQLRSHHFSRSPASTRSRCQTTGRYRTYRLLRR